MQGYHGRHSNFNVDGCKYTSVDQLRIHASEADVGPAAAAPGGVEVRRHGDAHVVLRAGHLLQHLHAEGVPRLPRILHRRLHAPFKHAYHALQTHETRIA